MLDIEGKHITWRTAARRDFLRVGSAAALGLNLAGWFRLKAAGAAPGGKAKAVIQLWMGGGPPQTDTFDPKPEAGDDYCGPFKKALPTKTDGLRLSPLMPLMAKNADKFTVVRSMTHMNNSHETATYIMQTSSLPRADLVYPATGAVVALKKQETQSSLPAYVTLTSPLGRFSEAGFLGNDYKTFAPGGDPNSKDFRVQGLVPPRGMTEQRFQDRRSLLEMVDAFAKNADKPAVYDDMDQYQQKAYSLILGEARKAFDLGQEPDAVRDKYGRNRFGQSCLLARRLVEHGVPFVTINDGGWDTHKANFEAMQVKLPILDKAFAALLEDLAERGLLDTTVVNWFGEFGRTPKIANEPPWFGGRHHHGNCFAAVVAGGGFQGGKVVGTSDYRGENVRDRAVYPWDLSASIYKLLGIDPGGRLPHPQGCVAYVSPIAGGSVQSGGLLTEIMRG